MPSPPGAPAAEAALPGHEGAPLALSVWPAEGETRAVVLAVHGYGDYGPSTFGEAAAFWAEHGVATYAYDQRGFGRNPSRGAWPGEEALIADFAAAARAVRAAHPDAPMIALGESLGAGVVLAALGEGRAPEVDAAILSAPAIAGGDRIGPLSRVGLWGLAAVLPDRRWTGEGLVTFQASDDIEMLRRLGADPVYLGSPSAREILGIVRVMDRARAAAPDADRPVLVLHGERDELVRLRDVEAVFGEIGGPARIEVYPEGWHLLLRDLQKRRVWEDVLAFALAQGEAS